LAVAVAVNVGVPFGNWVEVGVFVGKAVSVAGTVAEDTGIRVVAGIHAWIMSTRLLTTSAARIIISLSPFSH